MKKLPKSLDSVRILRALLHPKKNEAVASFFFYLIAFCHEIQRFFTALSSVSSKIISNWSFYVNALTNRVKSAKI